MPYPALYPILAWNRLASTIVGFLGAAKGRRLTTRPLEAIDAVGAAGAHRSPIGAVRGEDTHYIASLCYAGGSCWVLKTPGKHVNRHG